MTALEKQLEARIGTLERQLREMRKFLGMNEAEILEMEREEEYQAAMEQLRRGDASFIKAHLRKWNDKPGLRIEQ